MSFGISEVAIFYGRNHLFRKSRVIERFAVKEFIRLFLIW
jgi:hypothetical protein